MQRAHLRVDDRNDKLKLFDVGFFILVYIFSVFTVSTALFIVKIPITAVHGALSLIMTVAVMLLFYRKKSVLRITAAAVPVIIVCIFAMGLFFDLTWDGNCYRKTITYILRQGYNPIYEYFYEAVGRIGTIWNIDWFKWYDGYPKGVFTFSAVIYAMTGNVETGKCLNALLILSAGFMSFEIIKQLFTVKPWQAFLCAAALCLNPVAITQMINYYDDGALGMLFFICIASLLYLTMNKGGSLTRHCYAAVFASVAFGLNVKFSALIFFAIIVGAFFILWLVRDMLAQRRVLISNENLRHIAFFASCVVFGVCFFGLSSYVVNILRFKTPLYPVFGPGAEDILTGNTPAALLVKSRVGQVIASLLSPVSNSLDSAAYSKAPFSFRSEEFFKNWGPETRLGGWGVFFSGIFILSLIVLIIFLLARYKQNRAMCGYALFTFGIAVVPSAIVPGMFWARYNLLLYIVPVMALISLFAFAGGKNGGKNIGKNSAPARLIAPLVLSVMLLANMSTGIIAGGYGFVTSLKIRGQLRELKTLSESGVVQVRNTHVHLDFNGQFINMFDAGIKDFEIMRELDDYDGTFYPPYPVFYKIVPFE